MPSKLRVGKSLSGCLIIAFYSPLLLLFRDGHICETCISQRVPISGVLHRCYHDSLAASSVVAALIGFHKIRKSWTNDVDRLVANSHIVQQKLVLGGFPEQKISVIYNHLSEDPGMGSGAGGYALFVGRLSPEKGIATMLKAWSRLEMPLKIIGDGPLRSEIEKFCALSSFAEWLGQQSYIDTITAMKEACVLVFPSECYDTCPRVLLEACACGTPVVASDVGAKNGLVADGVTGLLFKSGDALDLAAKVTALQRDHRMREQMRQAARAAFTEKFTAACAAAAVGSLIGSL